MGAGGGPEPQGAFGAGLTGMADALGGKRLGSNWGPNTREISFFFYGARAIATVTVTVTVTIRREGNDAGDDDDVGVTVRGQYNIFEAG
jgi:hypothetical protein